MKYKLTKWLYTIRLMIINIVKIKRPNCPLCRSNCIVKNGSRDGRQKYRCKNCKNCFIERKKA